MAPSTAAPAPAPAPARATRDSSIIEEELHPSGDPDLLSSPDDTDSFVELGGFHQPGSIGARMKGPYSPESGEYDSEMEFLDSHVLPSVQTSFAVPTPAAPAPAPAPQHPGTSRQPAAGAPRPRGRQPDAAQVRLVVKGEEFDRMIGFTGRKPYILSKLRPHDPYGLEPTFDLLGRRPSARNGHDAVKKHFDVAHVKWEISVSKMASEVENMVKYGIMLRDEAHASHKWVGQTGTQTWGEDGSMKNYGAFMASLKKVKEMARKAEELVKAVEGDAKRWSMGSAKKRRDWDEVEISVTEESE
ncbi:hypothetical protein B0T09DRAFT_391055 [Sordaria sp. MPI-SDFR-AT-0083]|nr:hypothetical protein B0T09DRAFT_391055 [Sordaria sp. MPI-SDFR-AT-0083]